MTSDTIDRFWAKVRKSRSCWLWTASKLRGGYGSFWSPDDQSMLYAHRVSWALSRGPIPLGLFVLNRCDNPPCVNPDHLFLGTLKDNSQDCIAKRRNVINLPPTRRGESASASKLTEAQVIEIRQSDEPIVDIARRLGMSVHAIWSIKHGKTWSHLPGRIEKSRRAESPRGEDASSSKLKTSDVIEILNSKEKTKFLAKKYGVSYAAIYAIRKGRSWRHIPR